MLFLNQTIISDQTFCFRLNVLLDCSRYFHSILKTVDIFHFNSNWIKGRTGVTEGKIKSKILSIEFRCRLCCRRHFFPHNSISETIRNLNCFETIFIGLAFLKIILLKHFIYKI